MTNPRKAALGILCRSEKNGAYINLEAENAANRFDGPQEDKNLMLALAFGVAERAFTLDYMIAYLAHKGRVPEDIRFKNILRIGLYQLIYMDRIPDHAAINETVELCAAKSERSYANALLRACCRLDKNIPLPERKNGLIPYLSVKYSFPEWICSSFVSDYGEEAAEKALDFMSGRPGICLRTNTLRISRENLILKLRDAGIGATETAFSPHGISIPSGVPYSDLEKAAQGLFFIQDEASQLAVEAADIKEGMTFIDVCAAPGSKSFGAAMNANNRALGFSFDLHKNKLPLVSGGAELLGVKLNIFARDGKKPDETLFGKADRVICDLPCSGLGVMAKKQDIRNKKEADISRLPELQELLLAKSSLYLKRGGVLVYSTCTLRRAENEEAVKRFLDSNPGFSPLDFHFEGKGERLSSKGGCLTIFPGQAGYDGFFIARLMKNDA